MTPGIQIITLLTDFGLKDPYVGAMKGAILTIHPDARIVDISHDVSPQDVKEAAFLIEEYYRFFPPGTIHVAVIDPTVGSSRRPVIVSRENNVFIGPDNGLFSLVLDDAEIFLIENPDFMLSDISSTFHGRDIFAPVAAHASAGFHPSAFGRLINDPVCLDNLIATKKGDLLAGRIVRFDHFGNAITNVRYDALKDFLGNRSFEVHVGTMVFTALNKSYYEHDFTCFIGSSGYIEFGLFRGSFRDTGGAAKNDPVLISRL